MATVIEQLDALFLDKEVPVTKREIEEKLVLYTIDFILTDKHHLRVELIAESGVEQTDVQVTYRYVSMLTDYDKRGDLLEVLNELSYMATGYYTMHLAGDGEIYMRTLIRTHADVLPLYETLIQGPAIVRSILPQIEKVAGEFSNVK